MLKRNIADDITRPLKFIQRILYNRLLKAQEKQFNPKALLGSYKNYTRYNAFTRSKKPDFTPYRLKKESLDKYHNRQQHQKQWIKEMSLGGAKRQKVNAS